MFKSFIIPEFFRPILAYLDEKILACGGLEDNR